MWCTCVLCVDMPTGYVMVYHHQYDILMLLVLWHGSEAASPLLGYWIQPNIVSTYIIRIICFENEIIQILLTDINVHKLEEL